MDAIKVGKWSVCTAAIDNVFRRNVMQDVARAHLRKHAAEIGIDEFEIFVNSVKDNPEKYEEISEVEREFCDLSNSLSVWVAVAGCIKPYIKIEEWLTIGDTMLDDLTRAAQEKNPHWFALPKQDEEKKTSEPQMTSLEESETL